VSAIPLGQGFSGQIRIFRQRKALVICSYEHYSRGVSETEIKALKVHLERSKTARLRAWSVLQGLRDTLQAAGVIIPPSTEKSFTREGQFLERALKKALLDREDALRDLARAARWVDRSSFGKQSDFAQAHQALLVALEKAGRFV
jgi:hypothetical protein